MDYDNEKNNSNREVRPDEIDYTTLSGVLFLTRKNDLAFLAKKRVLVISEHQSTINDNMPLRDAIYYGPTMEQLLNQWLKTALSTKDVREFQEVSQI